MGFPFYEEQRITVTVLLFAVSSSGEVDLSVTFDTRDVMFCTFVAIQSFFSSTEEKDGMFCTVWQQRVFFAISKKDYNIFDDAQRFSSIKIKVIFCFFASKSTPPWSIFESSWTNGSRTLLKYKYWSSFFSQKDQVLMNYCCHRLDINAQVSGYPQTSTRNLSLSSGSNYLASTYLSAWWFANGKFAINSLLFDNINDHVSFHSICFSWCTFNVESYYARLFLVMTLMQPRLGSLIIKFYLTKTLSELRR